MFLFSIKLTKIVYRIFEYLFFKKIIRSITFRIFVLALVTSSNNDIDEDDELEEEKFYSHLNITVSHYVT